GDEKKLARRISGQSHGTVAGGIGRAWDCGYCSSGSISGQGRHSGRSACCIRGIHEILGGIRGRGRCCHSASATSHKRKNGHQTNESANTDEVSVNTSTHNILLENCAARRR